MSLTPLLREVRACRVCAPHLPVEPRPVLQFAGTARLLIVGQAPGSKAHSSGVPWDDASGRRLREWLELDPSRFHDASRIAILPIGFCYPGRAGNGADKPPRPECAPLWHQRLTTLLPDLRLTLLVGQYAQRRYLGPSARQASLTETVAAFADYLPRFFPLPHPSWRSALWMRKNPWFEQSTLPALREAVRACLDG
jgi:uracil-DNA glycosylase